MKTLEELYGPAETRQQRVDRYYDGTLRSRRMAFAVTTPEERARIRKEREQQKAKRVPAADRPCAKCSNAPRYRSNAGKVHPYCHECKKAAAKDSEAKARAKGRR